MLLTTNTKNLLSYFGQSVQFLYFLADKTGHIHFANTNFKDQFGNDIAGIPVTNFFSSADKLSEIIKYCIMHTDAPMPATLAMKFRNGSVADVKWEFSACIIEGENTEGVQGIGLVSETQQDMIEQQRAEEKIRYLAMLTDNVSDIIISQDKDFNIVSWNKAAAELSGYSSSEMIGKKVADRLHFEYQGITRAEFFSILDREGIWKGEAYVTNSFGKAMTMLISITKLTDGNGNVTGYVSVSKDITEKRKSEQLLKQSELFYRNLISESLDGIILADEKGYISFATPSGRIVLGYDPADITGKNIFEFVHPDDREKAAITFEDEVQMQSEVKFMNIRLLKKDGEWLWCIVRAHNMFQNPYIGKMIVYYHDDSARKKADDLLRQQAIILGNVSDVIMTMDFGLNILSWNKRAEQLTGYSADEAIGKFLGDIIRPDYGSMTASQSAEELSKNGYWQGEITFLDKQGTRKTVLHTASYFVNENGERIAIIGTGKDITEKQKAEETLHRSELFYRSLIANSLDGVLITNKEGVILFGSPSITAILGHKVEEITGKSTFDFVHPDDRPLAISAFVGELEEAVQQKFISIRLKSNHGDWIWCSVRGHNLLHDPMINGMLVYLYDDTKRITAESALLQSEARLRTQATILNNVTDCIITTDLHRCITSWNRVIEEMTGIPKENAIAKTLSDIFKMDYTPYTRQEVESIVLSHGIWKGEVSFADSNDEIKQLLYTVSLLYNDHGEQIGFLEVGRDISERKKAEEQLRQSEAFYRSMISHSLDGIVMTDIKGIVTYCSTSTAKLSGYKLEELYGRNLFEFVHPDDLQLALQAFSLESNKQSVLNYLHVRLLHANGSWVWCNVRGHNLLDNPVFKSILIYFNDDTRRKLMEDRLRESEFRLRNLIFNLKQGVLLYDDQGKLILSNGAALEILNVTEEQLTGAIPFDHKWKAIHEDGTDFPPETLPLPMVLKTRKQAKDVVVGVYRAATDDRIWVLVNADPVFDTDGNFLNVICSLTDITDQKKLSQRLIEQEIQKQKQITQATIDGQEKERLEIGKELHDNISQHLTTTRLYLEVVKEKASGELHEMISLSHKNLVWIINEIRNLSRSLVPPTLGDLGLIESIYELCDSIKKTNTIKVDFFYRHFNEQPLPENLKLMLFRVTQEQINNVIRHANASKIDIRLQSDAEFITLSIMDNGQGFDLDNYKKGLGFKNIANRVSLFNGKMERESAPGKGCLLTIHIPVVGLDHETN